MSLHEAKIGRSTAFDWSERLALYTRLVRLNRPIGIFLLMWPALWALWIAAQGMPPWWIAFIFVAGVILMRSAGCAINDFADRDFDGGVARTRERPIATGLVSPREAFVVFLVLSLVAFCLVLFLDWRTILLSTVALALTIVYPFMKRFTHVPQLFLGAAFGWAVPMAFTAITGSVPPLGWLMFGSAVVWALVYDTQYAMVDREDDLAVGIKSTAILFDRYDRLVVGLLQLLLLALLATVGHLAGRGPWYFAGLVIVGSLALHHQYLIRDRKPADCFRAFLGNNYLGMAVFLGLVADYAFG